MTGLIHLKKYANEATKTGERKGSILEKSPEKSPTRGSLSGSPANNRASHSFKNGHKFIDPALLSKICTEKEGKLNKDILRIKMCLKEVDIFVKRNICNK